VIYVLTIDCVSRGKGKLKDGSEDRDSKKQTRAVTELLIARHGVHFHFSIIAKKVFRVFL